MHIDWSQTQVYNTLMSVATGVGLLLIVRFSTLILRRKRVSLEGWSIGFTVPGFILTLLGAHMTLTWPLSKIGFPFDDIIFGETSLGFGVLLLAWAILLWRRANLTGGKVAISKEVKEQSEVRIAPFLEMIRPLSYFAAAMGLALISVAIAGIYYQLFAAPPEEPISGQFANYPMVEATFMSSLFAITGIGAILLPFSLNESSVGIKKVIGTCWTITGVLFTLFGAMNYFTHIGLIINTM